MFIYFMTQPIMSSWINFKIPDPLSTILRFHIIIYRLSKFIINMISALLLIAGAILLVVFLISRKGSPPVNTQKETLVTKTVEKPFHGHLIVAFGSQTGTAAKMAETFAEEAQQQGFTTDVLDLKDSQQKHFDGKAVVVFFLSNTGEGDPPDNTVEFIKILKNKGEKDIDFSKVKFTIFGLGNTQYQFFNKVAKDIYALLQKNKAQNIYKMGLGDNNASLEDDYSDWKIAVWAPLIEASSQIAKQSPEVQNLINERKNSESSIIETHEEKQNNHLAIWKFIPSKHQKQYVVSDPVGEQYDLQFLTKNYLKSEPATITNVHQVRQNTNDGSSVHIQIKLKQGRTYHTAGNLGVYPHNDPNFVKKVVQRFKLNLNQLYDIKYEGEKKPKLNFVTPTKFGTLVQTYIDLQHPITKSLLKNLAKLPSKNPQYFKENSSPKTTDQYKRLSSSFHTLIDLILQYDIDMTFETFVHLSDPIAPRLFTIASSSKVKKHVELVDSIEDIGLCSKFFMNNPSEVRVEIRDSSFHQVDIMNLDKVIFIGAGTGFAPFRAFLQQKEHLGKGPLVSLFFGCKHQNGDFIYRQEVNQWIDKGVINKFYPAFSRDQQYKVYVQTLLEQNFQQLRQTFATPKSALLICGSVSMGGSVINVITKFLQQTRSPEQAKAELLKLQKQKKIIKELW